MLRAVLVCRRRGVELVTVSRSRRDGTSSVRGLELASRLRSAALEGDEARIGRVLGDLLRVTGLSKGQRVALQLRALLHLVHSLRSAALSDEVTGLYNRRGFVQTATRLLDLAARDQKSAHLVYLRLEQLQRLREEVGPSVADVLLRQMGNFMRDLFPGYGVYDVLGRLSAHEFAAVTLSAQHASRSAVLLRAGPRRGGEAPALPLRVGVAHFHPARPAAVDELLASAAQAVSLSDNVARIASSGFAPQSGVTLC
jgi:diguanylate cyclase (GGDEF)-like protein